MTTRETLEAARATIADPERWVQGQERWANTDGSYRHCALGALRLVVKPKMLERVAVEDLLAEVTPDPPAKFSLRAPAQKVAFFNDTRTHADVLELFDRAIERAQEREELQAGMEEDVSLSRAQVALGRIEKVAA